MIKVAQIAQAFRVLFSRVFLFWPFMFVPKLHASIHLSLSLEVILLRLEAAPNSMTKNYVLAFCGHRKANLFKRHFEFVKRNV